MKKLNFKLISFFIFLAIIVVTLVRSCDNDNHKVETVKVNGKEHEIIKRVIDTFYVTKTKSKYVKGDDIYHEVIVEREKIVEVHDKIDTNKILQQYFQKIVYKDTLFIDSLGYVSVIDTISRNKIIGREWNSMLKEKTIRDVIIVKDQPKNKLYLGINTFINRNNGLNTLTSGLLLETKKEKIYQINAGLTNNNGIRPIFGFGFYWKLK